MNRYRVVYRRAWRADTGEEITPSPTVLSADGFETNEYGVTFHSKNPDRHPQDREVILWIPIDLVRSVRLEPGDEAPVPATTTPPT